MEGQVYEITIKQVVAVQCCCCCLLSWLSLLFFPPGGFILLKCVLFYRSKVGEVANKDPLGIYLFIYLFLSYRYIIDFFSFIFISWRLITLQYCSGSCHILTWISHGFTCIPHPNPPSALGRLRGYLFLNQKFTPLWETKCL